MLDPSEKTATAIKKVHDYHNEKYWFCNDLYPFNIMEQAYDSYTPPKTIFKPGRKLVRIMINALINKDKAMSVDAFLLKFGLIKGNPKHLLASNYI